MSSRPKRFSAWGPAAATLASMATSQRTKAALSPWPAAVATARFSVRLVSLRSATMTLAPSARKRMTVARPMPLAPPVTNATLPASRAISISPSAAPSSSELIVLLRRPAGKPSVSQKRGGPDEVRPFLRYFDPAAVDARDRAHGLQQLPRAGEAGRRAALRPCLGRRAPLPRGILALLRARAVPDRLRGADQAHPGRPRHRGLRAGVQPSDQDRRAHRHARYPVGRPPACRHGTLGHLDRAGRLRRQSRH